MTEQELINLLTKDVPRRAAGLSTGIGDDCAVIEGDGFDWLVTTDALLEGIHFNFEYTDDYSLGRKCLSVNLSDIAAMGGRPLFYTVTIGVPPHYSSSDAAHSSECAGESRRIKKLYNGMHDVSKSAGVVLIGGDTCASRSGLIISITVLGRVEKGKALLRSGARPGDAIYVMGTFGDAALGLGCLKRGCGEKISRCVIANEVKQSHGIATALSGPRNDFSHFIERYNNPTAQLEIGQWLAATGVVTSMIDVSDGLLADLGHIAEMSNVGFEIEAAKVPLTAGFSDISKEAGVDPLEIALTGGEDYELLFTSPSPLACPERSRRVGEGGGEGVITRIGKITSNPKDRIILDADGKRIFFSHTGFDHFA